MTHATPGQAPAENPSEDVQRPKRPYLPHAIRIFSLPIVLFWIVVAVLVNVMAPPQLEVVGELHSAPMAPEDAPSMTSMKLMGGNFKEFDSNSTVMVVIEGQQPLGPPAHDYYNAIIKKLQTNPQHIQHIQDFWGGDTLTAAGAQSADGKASYVMINLAGEQGGRRRPTRASTSSDRSSRRPRPHRVCRPTSPVRPPSPTTCTSSATRAWPRSR